MKNKKNSSKIQVDFSNNYFICDFKNHNYYFLETKEEQHIHKNYTYLL